MSEFEGLFSLFSDNENIVFVGHLNPDGDCVGSMKGLYNYFRGIKKNIKIVIPNSYPYFLDFLDEDKQILQYSNDPQKVEQVLEASEAIVCFDFNSIKRIDKLGDLVEKYKKNNFAVIDHHPGIELSNFGIAISFPQLSSTCEVVYTIIKEWEKNSIYYNGKLNNLIIPKKIPVDAAQALYCGLVTDTNNFSNSVCASTFAMGAAMLELGVDKEHVQGMIYGGFTSDRMRLMGYMLNENMKIYPVHKAGIMILNQDIKDKFNFQEGDSEGFVNLALGIRGLEVSALFTQSKDVVRVSLRSKSEFSVNKFAQLYFNGGGHEKASGGKITIPIEQVEEYFLKCIEEFTNKYKN